MSEPMSAVEIEDVLSSIRRLVSEDLRPTHKLVSAALQQGANKLILTPALRVVSNDAPGYVHGPDDLDDPRDLQSVLEAIETAGPQDMPEMVPMFGSVRLQEMADIAADGSLADEIGDPDANFLASAMSRINGLTAVDPASVAPPETIEAVVAVLGAAVGPDEWELDGGEPAPQAEAWVGSVWNSADMSELVAQDQPARVDAAEASQADADAGNQADEGADVVLLLSDPVLVTDAPEAVAARDAEPVEGSDDAVVEMARDAPEAVLPGAVDAGQRDDSTGQDSIVFHDPDFEQPPAGSTETQTAEITATIVGSEPVAARPQDDDGSFLNEDLLRQIVRDMVQAELQGTLGERITRNVRKLVRAEINRALASRDYD